MKLAVFLPNWIGDAVMATPALRAIRDRFRDAEVVGIMRPVIADTLAGSSFCDRVLLYNPRGKNPEQRGWRFLRKLRAEQCDTAILFPNSLRSAWLAYISGARRRIGFARDLRGWLLTDRVTPKSKLTPHPVLVEYLRLVEWAEGGRRKAEGQTANISRTMSLGVTVDAESQWQEFLAKSELRKADKQKFTLNSQSSTLTHPRLIAFNTGGAFGPAKNWPRESFVKLAQRIVDELGHRVILLCGPAERDDARWIAEQSQRSTVVSMADEPLSIGLTKAAVRGCDLLVTTDSGPRHFATAFGVPVITLFGPTHIAWSETFDPQAVHLQIPVDCGPCQQRECPLKHHRCMRDLTVEQVFAAVQTQLHRINHPLQNAA
ncbi:lipopolysaccharide heptosyltransferase II [bacterium]|nr:lipopolysaccharide heptosyltransferase II [bacterium]